MGEQILVAPFILLKLYTMCLGDRRTVHSNMDAPVAASLWLCQPQQGREWRRLVMVMAVETEMMMVWTA